MKKEIEKAVDTFHRVAFGTKKHGSKYISDSKLTCFISVLTELLFARYDKNWYPGNPERGSGYRCIRVNMQCVDPTIVESMKRANIILPHQLGATELTIWVDPGVVSVRIGEDGSIGTEIVDEAVYKMSLKSAQKPKKSGSVEEDELSSRSSSPDLGSQSDRSSSCSPTPIIRSTSPRMARASPIMEYNPYNPPSRVSYPQKFKRIPSTANTTPPKSVLPIHAFYPSQSVTPATSRSPMPADGSPISFSSPSMADYASGHGHIPGLIQQNQRMVNYTRPRAIFPASSSDNGSSVEGSSRITCNPYSMPFNYGHAMSAANFYDIPAMA